MGFLLHDVIGISIGIIYWDWCWCHVMPLYWCQCHGMWTALSIALLHFLGQDDKNEVHHDIFGHVTPLCWPQCHMVLAQSSMVPLPTLSQDKQNEVHHDLFIMRNPWLWYHAMPIALSMTLLHSISQDL